MKLDERREAYLDSIGILDAVREFEKDEETRLRTERATKTHAAELCAVQKKKRRAENEKRRVAVIRNTVEAGPREIPA